MKKKEHNVMFICSLHYLQSSVHRFSYMKYQRCFLRAPCLNWKDSQSYLSKAFDQDWLLLHNYWPIFLASDPGLGREATSGQLKSYQKLQLKNQKLLRNNHGKRSVGCKIFISSIKEEGLHHLSREPPNSIKQDGSSDIHSARGANKQPCPKQQP